MAIPTTLQQLDQRLADLEREIQTLRQSLAGQGPDEPAQQLVERRPDVCGGEPALVDTRTPVRAIVEHVRMGDEVADILEQLPYLSAAQVYAVLDYYRHFKQEIDNLIELNNDERFWQVWTQSAALSSI